MTNRCLALFTILLLSSCTIDDHFVGLNYRTIVDNDFKERHTILSSGPNNLLNPLKRGLDPELEFAYIFLLTYSPISDLADYSPDFLLANARLALEARNVTKWGNNIPYDIFLHYALPIRVNNENLDSFRIAFQDELIARVEGLDEASAALEINRWCHERVAYQPADDRTSSPLATILSARGRCGEESTLTVSALRAAGLPARQVYTPRWAHTDDNHAWVEVWIDGQWFYMGACEPEAVLDRGWFTEPSRRAMLIHTKEFGRYTGNEDVITISKRYSDINNLKKYAATKTIYALVTDTTGTPIPGIEVEFQLYNYSEFYPLAVIQTDHNGISGFTTGFGDMLIWAGTGNSFGFSKVTVSQTDTVTIVLNLNPATAVDITLDLTPPGIPESLPQLSPDIIKENKRLVARGDSIRVKYINSWINREDATGFATNHMYDPEVVADLIMKSEGNYREIMNFLLKNEENKSLAVELLKQISQKDLRDTKEFILSDHLLNSISYEPFFTSTEKQLFYDYVLNPRIADEMLSDWRGVLKDSFKDRNGELTDTPEKPNIDQILKIASEKIEIIDNENHYGTPITPKGVESLHVSDIQSFNIYLIALLRSLGIPARPEPGTHVPQYWQNGEWHDINQTDSKSNARATVSFAHDGSFPVPEYYVHFTLAKYENGKYKTLKFNYNKKCTSFADSVPVIPGDYMVVTGNRLGNGRILTDIRFFSLSQDEHMAIDVTPRKEQSIKENYGIFPAGSTFKSKTGDASVINEKSESGIFIAWVAPGSEPSRHLLNELADVKGELEKWGGQLYFLVNDKNETEKLDSWENIIPTNSTIGFDPEFALLKDLLQSANSIDSTLPYVMFIDRMGKIRYVSTGYRIGIAAQMLLNTR